MKNGSKTCLIEILKMNDFNDILICPTCRLSFEKINNSKICNNNTCSNFKTPLKIKDKFVFIDFSNFMISKTNFLEFNSSSNNVRETFLFQNLSNLLFMENL